MNRIKDYLWPLAGLAAVCFSGWLLFQELKGISADAVLDSLADIPAHRWALAVLSTFVAYGALAWYDRIALMHLGHKLGWGFISAVSFSTYALSHNIGASVFSLVFRGLGGDDVVHELLTDLPGGALGAMIIVMAMMFLLGFILDFIEITYVVVPIVAPVLLAMGLDPVWLGVMIAMNLQTSFLTPPFCFALFYLRGVAPESISTGTIYKGIIPWVGLQLLALVIIAIWPQIVTWLPNLVYGDTP